MLLSDKDLKMFCMVIVATTALFCCSFVCAADFPQRIDGEKRSKIEGLGQKEVSILKRVPGLGREIVCQELIEKFHDSKTATTTKGAARSKLTRNGLSVAGPGWFLDVNGDGSNVRYRNYAHIKSRKDLVKPVAQRLSNDILESIGRQFIEDKLYEHVRLGKEDELVPFFTEHAVSGSAEVEKGGSQDGEEVSASIVVFTRKVNNINIIGPGSKIAILFDNEGTPFGFDYDWPQYEMTGKSQKVLPVHAIQERGNRYGIPKQNSPNLKIDRFDCGLYDPGARRHDSTSIIQSACLVSYSETAMIDQDVRQGNPKRGHVTSAKVKYIPCGEVIEKDVEWPEAMKMIEE